jgi:hypothetical protein
MMSVAASAVPSVIEPTRATTEASVSRRHRRLP